MKRSLFELILFLKDYIFTYKKFDISFFEALGLFKTPHRSGETRLLSKRIEINNAFWYLHGVREIFKDEVYKFISEKGNPYIIDCGANIGLSVIYFKRLFPKSEITAFEADPEIAKVLEKNLGNFGINDVEIVPKAVWVKDEQLSFASNGSVGGQIISGEDDGLKIEGIRLKNYLTRTVDFLKIDIEGAEYEVIKDCSENLGFVQNIFIEYHSFLSQEQTLDEILLILKNAGFKYYIKEAWNNNSHPYLKENSSHYDLQLNIFGYRL